jgi:hypothetical protein
MALPLGEAGITEIPSESAVLKSMQSSIADSAGLYIFPGLAGVKMRAEMKRVRQLKGCSKKSRRIRPSF